MQWYGSWIHLSYRALEVENRDGVTRCFPNHSQTSVANSISYQKREPLARGNRRVRIVSSSLCMPFLLVNQKRQIPVLVPGRFNVSTRFLCLRRNESLLPASQLPLSGTAAHMGTPSRGPHTKTG